MLGSRSGTAVIDENDKFICPKLSSSVVFNTLLCPLAAKDALSKRIQDMMEHHGNNTSENERLQQRIAELEEVCSKTGTGRKSLARTAFTRNHFAS